MHTNFFKRDISIDLIKLIAIICVVIIHSCDFTSVVASPNWNYSLLYRTLSGAGVPLFLMSSGAVMLSSQKELSLKKLYFKNILRILIAMVFWGIIYKIHHLFYNNELSIAGILNGIKEVLVFNQEFHFYYMHIILIVYAFLPVTRIIAENSSKRVLEYFLVLWVLLAILYPTVRRFYPFSIFGGMTATYGINLTYASIGYGLLGFYLKKYPLKNFYSVLLFISGLCLTFGLTYYKSAGSGVLYEHFLAGNGIPVCFMAAGIFSFVSGINIKNTASAKIVTYISKSSFCIYLVHMLVMYILKENGINTGFASNLISIPLFAALVLAVSVVIYFVLSKIPFVKKWLI